MFESRDHAREVIRQFGVDEAEDEPMSAAEIELLLANLVPQFWIAPSEGSAARPGTTRFGGAPDLAAGASWPIRPAPPDAARAADDLQQHFEWIAKHIVRDLPFEFLAEIDLAEAAAHAGHASDLPKDGRLLFFWDGVLLFFWDGVVGLLRSDPATCRVIWDETPADARVRLPVPPLLTELEAAYDPEGRFKKPYVYPQRAMRLAPILTLPSRFSADVAANRPLDALAGDTRFETSYELLTAMDEGQFTTDGRRGARLQRFLGSPIPEQDDPRFDAIVADGFPPAPWRGEHLAQAAARALDWQLLLQLDLGDLSQQEFTEGTVYFLIRKADLAARDFSRVYAVYQQT